MVNTRYFHVIEYIILYYTGLKITNFLKTFKMFLFIFLFLLLGFSNTDGFTSLMMAKIIDKALSVIYDCIGDELCGLRLAKNKITSCDGLRCLPALFPNLKILDLSDNDVI